MKKIKKLLKPAAILAGTGFALMNLAAWFHAGKFTKFSLGKSQDKGGSDLTPLQQAQALLTGVHNPRPVNDIFPSKPFTTFYVESPKKLECWYIKADNPLGTVLIFHGYGGSKSSQVERAEEFLKMGYNTVLVDFTGSGGSEGNETTIGYKEADQVKACYDYLRKNEKYPLVLFGVSMGAVAIMKSIRDYDIKPKAIVLECPFGSMYKTTCARFRNMNVPAFPFAGLLLLWGSIRGGFPAFSHKPIEYAKHIKCPTLLLHGEKDDKVSMEEIQLIYRNLTGPKSLKIYSEAGHESYLLQYRIEWLHDISFFLSEHLSTNKGKINTSDSDTGLSEAS